MLTEVEKDIQLYVIDDDKAERDETMKARLGATNAERGNRSADGVIYDDDSSQEIFSQDVGVASTIDLTTIGPLSFDLGPAAAFSLIYFIIILLFSVAFYQALLNVGRGEKE